MRRSIVLLPAVLALLAWTGLSGPMTSAAAIPSAPTGKDPYLKPVILDPHGRTIRLADFRGKVRVFEIWASWCGPCRMEIPQLNAIYERYRSRGLVVVGLSVDDRSSDVLRFVEEVPIRYPHGMMNPEAASVFGMGGGEMAIPLTFVVDRTGKLRRRFIGLMSPDLLEREIAAIL